MPMAKDTTFKIIGKDFIKIFFELIGIDFKFDFDEIEELTTELILLEGEVKKPDAIFAMGNIILMLEYQSSKLKIADKKRFKVYVSVYDLQKNKDNKEIIFAVISTVEDTKMEEYCINDWDCFKFPIFSIRDFNLDEIINNIEYKLKNNKEFSDEELVKLALTPILPQTKEEIINQFHETADLISKIDFPNNEIKNSVCGIVLMLSNVYFDETDMARKQIQGVYMGKVDCVVEALQETYDEGKNDNSIEIAKKLLNEDVFSLEKISEITDLPISDIEELKNDI